MRVARFVVVVAFAIVVAACADEARQDLGVPDRAELAADKSSAAERALRRAYDGAPPAIPHADLGSNCTACHNDLGMQVPGLGFAPPMPHENTPGLSGISRCKQCHVFKAADGVFRASSFVGRPQDMRRGKRQHSEAPPVIPHPIFMRENCKACHSGLAAREEIRCDHPERTRCTQCHLEQRTMEAASFSRE